MLCVRHSYTEADRCCCRLPFVQWARHLEALSLTPFLPDLGILSLHCVTWACCDQLRYKWLRFVLTWWSHSICCSLLHSRLLRRWEICCCCIPSILPWWHSTGNCYHCLIVGRPLTLLHTDCSDWRCNLLIPTVLHCSVRLRPVLLVTFDTVIYIPHSAIWWVMPIDQYSDLLLCYLFIWPVTGELGDGYWFVRYIPLFTHLVHLRYRLLFGCPFGNLIWPILHLCCNYSILFHYRPCRKPVLLVTTEIAIPFLRLLLLLPTLPLFVTVPSDGGPIVVLLILFWLLVPTVDDCWWKLLLLIHSVGCLWIWLVFWYVAT